MKPTTDPTTTKPTTPKPSTSKPTTTLRPTQRPETSKPTTSRPTQTSNPTTSTPTVSPSKNSETSSPSKSPSQHPETLNPTGAPTLPLSDPPTDVVCGEKVTITVNVFTDRYPDETSWKLTDTCTGSNMNAFLPARTLYTSESTSYSITFCVTPSAYQFSMFDSSNDGICCSWGVGSYTVSYGADEVASGGDFEASESTLFGSCLQSPMVSIPNKHFIKKFLCFPSDSIYLCLPPLPLLYLSAADSSTHHSSISSSSASCYRVLHELEYITLSS